MGRPPLLFLLTALFVFCKIRMLAGRPFYDESAVAPDGGCAVTAAAASGEPAVG